MSENGRDTENGQVNITNMSALLGPALQAWM
jgi:hypothetical protein